MLLISLFAKHKGISNNSTKHNIMANGLSIQNNKIKNPVNWIVLIKNTWNETKQKADENAKTKEVR